MNDVVYGLWFVQERENVEDIECLIGIYKTEADAKAAIEQVKDKKGFIDFPQGFEIHEYLLGRTGWLDGFIIDTSE
ncbi:MAG TPA: hypothetical protein VKB26_03140 [Candidatus Acidoferrales bacterium]|nr:hypothetical protein [Candidatus Acidoferrales bacterium]